jgi:uracil-DNA glycosylase
LAHKATLATLGYTQSAFKFGHAAMHDIERGDHKLLLANSYHCSRYNTNTGRLTTAMFEDVFTIVREHLDRLD